MIFAGVANKVDTSVEPEYKVFPERIVPNTVLPAMFPPVTVPKRIYQVLHSQVLLPAET